MEENDGKDGDDRQFLECQMGSQIMRRSHSPIVFSLISKRRRRKKFPGMSNWEAQKVGLFFYDED